MATLTPRFATPEDEDHVVAMAREFIETGPYQGANFDEAAVRELFRQLIAGLGAVFVHERGFIAGVLTPLFFSPSVKIATELAWWAPGANGQGLKEAFEGWAAANGADAVQISTLNNALAAPLARSLTEDGYVPVEISYVKAL